MKSISFKAVNYTEIIPIMVKAIQELSITNDELRMMNQREDERIDNLQLQIDELKVLIKGGSGVNKQVIELVGTASLEQNSPNPFNGTTVIKYHLPTGTKNAVMNITNAIGSVVKSIALTGAENGQVTLNAGKLGAGTYFYSLLLDGRKVATKEMQMVR